MTTWVGELHAILEVVSSACKSKKKKRVWFIFPTSAAENLELKRFACSNHFLPEIGKSKSRKRMMKILTWRSILARFFQFSFPSLLLLFEFQCLEEKPYGLLFMVSGRKWSQKRKSWWALHKSIVTWLWKLQYPINIIPHLKVNCT